MSHVPGHRNGGATPAEDLSSSLNETLGNEARATELNGIAIFIYQNIQTTLFLCRSKSWS